MSDTSDATQMPAPAPAKGGKCLGLACLAMIGCCVLLMGVAAIREAMKSPEQRAAEAKEREEKKAAAQAEAKATLAGLAKKFVAIAKALPKPQALAELPAPDLKGRSVELTAADPQFFDQFDESGWVAAKDSPPIWYRSSKLDELETVFKKLAAREELPTYQTRSLAEELEKRRYLGVFYPVQVRQPRMSDDKKSFSPGLWDGWVVLVELDTARVVRATRFDATSSDTVKDKSIKIKGIKFGSNPQKAVEDDFHQHFLAEAVAAIQR